MQQYTQISGMMVTILRDVPTDSLEDFFAAQPDEAYTYFKPHGFDIRSFKKLQRNRSFLAYILMEKDNVNS